MVGLSCGVPRKNLPVSFDLPCKAQAVLARVSAKASEKEASEGCSVALLLAGQIRVSGLGGKTHRKINRTTRTPILRVQHLHCVLQWVSLFFLYQRLGLIKTCLSSSPAQKLGLRLSANPLAFSPPSGPRSKDSTATRANPRRSIKMFIWQQKDDTAPKEILNWRLWYGVLGMYTRAMIFHKKAGC